jgi:hypothetical protein
LGDSVRVSPSRAERPEQVTGLLQVAAGRGVRRGGQPERQSGDHRVDAAGQHRSPDDQAERDVDVPAADLEHGQREGQPVDHRGDQQRHRLDLVGVGDRDDDQRHEVVDHRDGHQEQPGLIGHAAADQREQAEGERGVGRHRHAPRVPGRTRVVGDQEDRHRDDQADHAGRRGQDEPPPVAQVAQVELAPRLQADDQEEERHQPAVDPLPQAQRDAGAAEVEREVHLPETLVRPVGHVCPEQRGDDRRQQHAGAAGLGAQEAAQRGAHLPRPGGATLHRRFGCGVRHGNHPTMDGPVHP